MGYASRDDDYVTFGELERIAAVDGFAANLSRAGRSGIDHTASGDESGFSIHHPDEVGILLVNFSHTRFLAPAGVDHVVAICTVYENGSLAECRFNVL
jgi:hypothetical protein